MPSYHLCPDFRIPPPPNGRLTLGTILKNLEEDGVQYPLSAGVPVPTNLIEPRDGPHTQRGFTRSMKDLRSVEGGIWAKIFGIDALAAKFSRSHGSGEILSVKELLTREFMPDDEYMYKSLEIPRVETYVTTRKLAVPVYMITGVMIARGASWSGTETKATQVGAEGGLSDTNTASSVGGNLEYRMQNERVTGVEDSDDFVLGIRVRKIWWEDGIRQTSDTVVGRVLGSGRKNKVHIGSREAGVNSVDDFELDDPDATPDMRVIDQGALTGMEPVVWILH